MEQLQNGYQLRCQTPGDIHEHLPTLKELAQECNTVLECGVAGCVSSWALALGLAQNLNGEPKKLGCCDINVCPLGPLPDLCKQIGIECEAYWKNDLEIDEEWDFVFIDSLHIFGQLIRELKHFGPKTKKYIAMHDTTIDGFTSEIIRSNWNVEEWIQKTGWSRIELETGLQPAIDQFLSEHPEWEKFKEYTNNNGLTILKRK